MWTYAAYPILMKGSKSLIIVAGDYFSKWIEVKVKAAQEVAIFFYELCDVNAPVCKLVIMNRNSEMAFQADY